MRGRKRLLLRCLPKLQGCELDDLDAALCCWCWSCSGVGASASWFPRAGVWGRGYTSVEFHALLPPLCAFTPPSISGPAPSLRPLGVPFLDPFWLLPRGILRIAGSGRFPTMRFYPPSISARSPRRGGKSAWNSTDVPVDSEAARAPPVQGSRAGGRARLADLCADGNTEDECLAGALISLPWLLRPDLALPEMADGGCSVNLIRVPKHTCISFP